MSKTIGVLIHFLTDEYREQINAAAAENGYEVKYFRNSASAVGNADDCEIFYGHPSQKVIASAKNLKWFACCWAGINQFCDESLFCNKDCILTNSSGSASVSIAEHIIMTALMMLRRQPEYDEITRAGEWKVLDGPIHSLIGSRITTLSTGDIATEFVRRVRPFKPAKIIGVSHSGSPKPDYDEVYPVSELDSLLPNTDLLVMALPSTPETEGVLSRERLALLPEGAFVINIGRGNAIDQDALCDALNSGHLGGAALDVMVPEPLPADHPLRKARNILITPHVSGNMALKYTSDLNVQMFCDNLARYAKGEALAHVIDKKKGY